MNNSGLIFSPVEQSRKVREAVAGFEFGPSMLSLRSKVFGKRGKQRLMGLGGFGYGLADSGLMFGGEGSGVGRLDPYHGGEVSTGAGWGSTEIGVMGQQTGPFRLYPLIGLGGGGGGLAYFSHPIRELQRGERVKPEDALGSGGPFLILGVGIEVRAGQRVGLLFGLRFGYMFSPFSLGDKRVRLSAPFVRYIVGGFLARG